MSDYETKFAMVVEACKMARTRGVQEVRVAHPAVLGDNYEELVESLDRIADAGLSVVIASSSKKYFAK